jgi:hypothetical protein
MGTGEAPLPAGNARYNIKDFVVQLHKLEVKTGGLTARAFYTKEDAGKTTQSTALATSVALAQPLGIQGGWGTEYLNTYLAGAAIAAGFAPDPQGIFVQQFLGSVANDIQNNGGTSIAEFLGNGNIAQGAIINSSLHQAARAAADANMLMPGDADFNAAIDAATDQAILQFSDTGTLGALIKDLSEVSTFEANYDFEDKISFANLIVGGLYRSFNLDTDGTLYTDYDDPIEYNEFGVFAQMQKDLFDDNVSLTASMRYDKQSVMEDANVTPRMGLLFKLSDKSNVRVSAQLGFRNPTNQDKFIGLYNGQELLLGTQEDNIDRFNQQLGSTDAFGFPLDFNWTGDWVFNNAYNKSAFDGSGTLLAEELDYIEAEKVTSYDIGYRYNTKNFTLDVNAYYSQYENFIGTNSVYVPAAEVVGLFMSPQGGGLTADQAIATTMGAGAFLQFGMDANLDVPFDTFGMSLEAITKLNASTTMNFIYEYNELDYEAEANSDFELSWNTPKHRMKFGFTSKLGDGATLSANARYNSEYYYESSFIDATIRENTVFDAKLMFGIKALDNLQFEVGGNNIAGREYVSIPGSGNIGSLYYAGAKMQF